MQVIRFVGVIRQSKFKGEQAVSQESQRAAITAFVENKNRQLAATGVRWDIIDWAIDIGVSADKYDPWQRPQLGPWFKKPEAWDGMISFKLDRLARSSYDFVRFGKYLDDYNKVYVCSDDMIDMTTDVGRMCAAMLSHAAELDLKNIKRRSKATRDTLNEQGRWTGGHVPYARTPVQTDKGWKLLIDPEAAKVFRRILHMWDVDGLAFNEIAKILNSEGVPTSRANQDRNRGRKDKHREWQGSVISKMLRSRHLIGQREIKGVVLRDDAGEPIIYCEPLMKPGEWNRLQRKLDDRAGTRGRARKGGSLARKVGGCLDCESFIQMTNSPTAAQPNRTALYRCATIGARTQGRKDVPACDNPTIPAPVWEGHLESSILDMVGSLPRMRKVYQAGEDHTEELDRVDDSITSLTRERDMGLVRSEEEYFTRLKALMDRRNKLLELPAIPAGWRYEPTGETVAEYWAGMDREQRNFWLQEMGVRLYYSMKTGTPRWRMVWGDLAQLAELAQGANEPEPAA
jgi:site-specific DNA recombinase